MFDFMVPDRAFTIRDAIEIVLDGTPAPNGNDAAEVIEQGMEEGYLPDAPYYHSLARAARRIPASSIRRMIDQRPPFA